MLLKKHCVTKRNRRKGGVSSHATKTEHIQSLCSVFTLVNSFILPASRSHKSFHFMALILLSLELQSSQDRCAQQS